MSIESIRAKHEQRLMSLPNVNGVGIGEKDGKPVIKVYVTQEPVEGIPKTLDGVDVEVEAIGPVQAQAKSG